MVLVKGGVKAQPFNFYHFYPILLFKRSRVISRGTPIRFALRRNLTLADVRRTRGQ